MSDDELTPEERFAAPEPDDWVPKDLARGRSYQEIYDELIKLDWSPTAAAAMIDGAVADLERYAASPESRRQLVRGSLRHVIGGAVVVAMGALMLAGTLLIFSINLELLLASMFIIAAGFALLGYGYSRWRTFRRDDLFVKARDDSPET